MFSSRVAGEKVLSKSVDMKQNNFKVHMGKYGKLVIYPNNDKSPNFDIELANPERSESLSHRVRNLKIRTGSEVRKQRMIKKEKSRLDEIIIGTKIH